MDKIKKILYKIKNYFMQLFNKQSVRLIEDNTNMNIQDEKLFDEVEDKEQKKEKDEFFTIFNNVKNGTIQLTDLMIDDLIKVQVMMQEEVKVIDYKIESLEKDLEDLNVQKYNLIKERQYYSEKYKS